jgi:hypothetical protein
MSHSLSSLRKFEVRHLAVLPKSFHLFERTSCRYSQGGGGEVFCNIDTYPTGCTTSQSRISQEYYYNLGRTGKINSDFMVLRGFRIPAERRLRRLSLSVCSSVCNHVAIRELLNKSVLNFIWRNFTTVI